MMGDGFGMGFGGGFMWIFWVLLIIFIVWVIKATAGGSNVDPPKRQKSALEILEERYAKGEMGQDEFEQKRKNLST